MQQQQQNGVKLCRPCNTDLLNVQILHAAAAPTRYSEITQNNNKAPSPSPPGGQEGTNYQGDYRALWGPLASSQSSSAAMWLMAGRLPNESKWKWFLLVR